MPLLKGDPEDTYRAALVRAAEILGSVRALSDRLRVPMASLTYWLAGDGKPPMGVFLQVVDVLIEESQKSRLLPRADELKDGNRTPDATKR
jgi:hypothetical protein